MSPPKTPGYVATIYLASATQRGAELTRVFFVRTTVLTLGVSESSPSSKSLVGGLNPSEKYERQLG